MSDRNSSLTELRPEIPQAKIMSDTGEEERFQNQTLRPIAKFQNNLLIDIFKRYIKKRKNIFYKHSLQEKQEYIEHAIKKDLKFRNMIKGVFIGLFTDQEFAAYSENSSKLDKRIANLTIERLISNIQYLENSTS